MKPSKSETAVEIGCAQVRAQLSSNGVKCWGSQTYLTIVIGYSPSVSHSSVFISVKHIPRSYEARAN